VVSKIRIGVVSVFVVVMTKVLLFAADAASILLLR
jgi:hypothetical protein